jgi:alkanesulfonate monooxygenase SsuD/methylene tetrahydromethanopterin reductase-like flavin-dependent oxidoreductase (luciferase family)
MGVAAGALAMDQYMFGTNNETNRAMLRESLDMMIRLFTDEKPFEIKGKYFTTAQAERQGEHYAHLKPLQRPHPPIAMAGAFSTKSESLALCGERGFRPISLNMASHFTAQHWASVEAGARKSGRTPRRSDWAIVRDVLVAETDKLAWEYAVNGAMGRMFREYFLPLMSKIKTDRLAIEYFAASSGVALPQITTEYCAEHNWLIGSPDTVVKKIERMYEEVGGFGTLLLHAFDYADAPEQWRRSLQLLGSEVLPRLKHLNGDVPERALQTAAAV